MLGSAVSVRQRAAGAAPPKPAGPTFEQKMAWILRLEDQRMLRDPRAAVAPPPPPVAARGQAPCRSAPPPPPPDLVRLLSDDEARIRRRAALAIGRVGLADGVHAAGRRCWPTAIPKCGRWRRSRSACSATRARAIR